ncbi:MAG: hypothetical protein HZA18_03845 [Nitrospirae bacterium]|nr:hypothetical protein [Nitrospirota bacterium]
MKKRIYSIIAVAIAVTVWHAMPAFAAKIDVGGDLRARAYYVQSQDFTKTGDANWLDARFRLDAKVSQGMTTGVLQVDFLNASMANDGDTTGNLVLGNDTGHSYALVGVRQAYLAVNFPAATVIGGRYEVKLGNGLVMNDTADLVAVAAPIGPVNLLVGYLLLGEDDAPATNSGPRGAGDDTAFAVNAGIKDIAGSGFGADLFVVAAALNSVSVALDPTNTQNDTKLQVIGLTGNGKVGPADVAAEVDIFRGDVGLSATQSGNFKGSNFLLSGSMPAGPVGLNAAILYASGQDTSPTSKDVNINTIDGDFRASNILVRDDFNNHEGVTSIGGGSMVSSYVVGGKGLQAIKAAVTLPSMKGAGMTHTPEVGLVWAQTSEDVVFTSKKSSDLGVEVYANTNCVVDKNLSANIGVAYLAAGDALGSEDTSGNFISPDDQLKLEASLTFHF